jgi:hypothetical protein
MLLFGNILRPVPEVRNSLGFGADGPLKKHVFKRTIEGRRKKKARCPVARAASLIPAL